MGCPSRSTSVWRKAQPEFNLACFGGAIGLFACAAFQALFAHGCARAIAGNVHQGWFRLGGVRFKPWSHPRSDLKSQSLNLARWHFDAAVIKQVLAGFLIWAFGGSAAEHSRQGRSVGAFQRQRRIGRTMPL